MHIIRGGPLKTLIHPFQSQYNVGSGVGVGGTCHCAIPVIMWVSRALIIKRHTQCFWSSESDGHDCALNSIKSYWGSVWSLLHCDNESPTRKCKTTVGLWTMSYWCVICPHVASWHNRPTERIGEQEDTRTATWAINFSPQLKRKSNWVGGGADSMDLVSSCFMRVLRDTRQNTQTWIRIMSEGIKDKLLLTTKNLFQQNATWVGVCNELWDF